MSAWTFAVSAADGRARTTEELAALLPALSEVIGVRLAQAGELGEVLSGRGVDESGTEFWLSGMLCEPGAFGRHESYQIQLSVDAVPAADPEAIARWLFDRIRAGEQFHAVLMSNSTAVEATEAGVDIVTWWT